MTERDPHEVLHSELSERYLLEGELGRGGMGTVFVARDRRREMRVAIKVIHPELVAGTARKRFEREISITAKLEHPRILPLLESGIAGELPYYVSPLVEGESLRRRLKRLGQLPIDEVERIIADVAEGLDYAHAQGVIHRDIKPDNILLSDGGALIADFGVAQAANLTGQTKLTGTDVAVGTAVYMSPEQIAGIELDGRADVYSLGCVVYEMLVGRPPFVGDSVESVIKRHVLEPPPTLRSHRRTVPRSAERAIKMALEKQPSRRQSSAGELAKALEDRDGPMTGAFSWLRFLFR